jgi:mitochondrial fission protein ELM1
MTGKSDLPVSVSSCWVVTEGLIGLQNQAIGLAQALEIPYVLKEVKKPRGLKRLFSSGRHDFSPPWPDLLITCGRQSVSASIAVRRASAKKTFTVHIQDPQTDPRQFDVVIVPAHDKLQGDNVLVTQGAIHQVTAEKLKIAAEHFRPLLGPLPRPLMSVLVGGKNRHQGFTRESIGDFARKLRKAATNSGGGLAVSTSRRTGSAHEALLREKLEGIPSFIWSGTGENPYLGMLALADAIVVTSDSISMISEACSTGRPVYIYELAQGGRRHKELCASLVKAGMARPFLGNIETWTYTPLNETRKAADFVCEQYFAKNPELKLNIVH